MSSCRCRVGRGGRADSRSENPFSGVLEPPLPSLKGGGRFPAWTWRSCSKSLRAALTSQFFPVRTQNKKWIGCWEYRKIEERHRTIILSILPKPASIYSCTLRSSFSFPYSNFLQHTSVWNTAVYLLAVCFLRKLHGHRTLVSLNWKGPWRPSNVILQTKQVLRSRVTCPKSQLVCTRASAGHKPRSPSSEIQRVLSLDVLWGVLSHLKLYTKLQVCVFF